VKPQPEVVTPLSTAELVDAVLASSRALVALSARSIADNTDVTLPQYRMLVVLEHAPSNLTGLAEALDVIPSTAMRMVDRLVAAGLIQRTVPPEDRRVTLLELTAVGRQTVHRVTRKRRRDLQRVIERIPEQQRPALAMAMAAFADAADQVWPTRHDLDV
jgi:DNA-binding MarR family transcriptional regulator